MLSKGFEEGAWIWRPELETPPPPPPSTDVPGDVLLVDNDVAGVDVHISHHSVVICGGYVGCPNCLLYSSRNGERNRLRQACRGAGATPNHRGRREVRNLTLGLPPHGHVNRLRQHNFSWPTGDSDPRPVIVPLASLSPGSVQSASGV